MADKISCNERLAKDRPDFWAYCKKHDLAYMHTSLGLFGRPRVRIDCPKCIQDRCKHEAEDKPQLSVVYGHKWYCKHCGVLMQHDGDYSRW
jgi:hypothetical protein